METKKNVRKILLVDNDEMMKIYFRDIFWVHGCNNAYEVEVASSLEEAEKKIRDEKIRPSVIFLDVLIKESNINNSAKEQMDRSVAFIEKIKSDKDLSHIKIIIYSNQKEESIKKEVSKFGVDGYITKGDLMPKEVIGFVDKIYESNNKN